MLGWFLIGLGVFGVAMMLPNVDWPWEPEMRGSVYRLRMVGSAALALFAWVCYRQRTWTSWTFGAIGLLGLWMTFPSGA